MNASEVPTETEIRSEGTAANSSDVVSERCALYLFARHAAWRIDGNLKAYQEILAALDDCNPNIRSLAEHLLNRASPRPVSKEDLG